MVGFRSQINLALKVTLDVLLSNLVVHQKFRIAEPQEILQLVMASLDIKFPVAEAPALDATGNQVAADLSTVSLHWKHFVLFLLPPR